jgi:hypothetical protein
VFCPGLKIFELLNNPAASEGERTICCGSMLRNYLSGMTDIPNEKLPFEYPQGCYKA